MKNVNVKGSALVAVLMIVFITSLLVGSILYLTMTERRLNVRNIYWTESRMAAEAVAEYGMSQVRSQFEAQATPPTFRPGSGNPLVVPPSSFFTGSSVDYSSLEVIGGPIQLLPAVGLYFLDPNDPNNQYDPMKGLWVLRRDIAIIAKATTRPPGAAGAPITSYVKETISVRGAPLFSHAIYYAKDDLEIFPGPQMDIYGPVHSNGNMFVSSQGNQLNFHGTVSASGGIFHAWSNSNNAAKGSGNEALGSSPVQFTAPNGVTLVNMNRTGAATGWMDSTTGLSNNISGTSNLMALITPEVTSKFRQSAAQLWGGNVQTGAMGVQDYNPIAFNEIIGRDASNNPIYPDPHCMIEPPTPPAAGDPYFAAKTQVELQKFSTQSNLYVKVTWSTVAAGTTPTPTVEMFGPSSTPGAGPNGYVSLIEPSTNLIVGNPYKSTKVSVAAKLTSGANSGKYPVTTITTTSAGSSSRVDYLASLPAYKLQGGNIPVGSSETTVDSGMYDNRRDIGIDLVELDMTLLRTTVGKMVSNTIDANTIKNPDGSVFNGWNGGVYVEVVDTSPKANTSTQSASLRLINGTVAANSTLMPDYGINGIGLTIATNAPVYIKGNFNADGTIDTTAGNSSSMYSDGLASKESPACIAGDAITILSSTFNDTTSLTAAKPQTTVNTEIAAAFLTGLVITGNTANSGGAHNLPRFLESFTNYVALRGSLVCMYRSKIATQPWSTSYYGAPKRLWGFSKTFQNGNFPPLTPKVMSFRRVNCSLLTPTEYNTLKSTLWP